MNAATKESKGFEVMTTLIPIRTKTVEWELTVNFSNPHSKVTSLAHDIENVSLNTGFVDPQFHAVVGQPYRTIWGTRWLRDKSGSLIIEDDPKSSYYGMPVVDTKSGIIGNVEPKWTMGITNSLRIDHIKLSFLVDIKTGGQMWNGTKGAMYYFGTHKDTEGRTTATTTYTGILGHIDSKSGTVAHYDGSSNSETDGPGSKVEVTMPLNESWYYKGLGNGFNGPAEQFIEKTDWIRLREVSISYDFPSKFLAKSTIQQLEIYFTGHNLWIKTPYTGVDPETSLFGASNAQGADYFNMPGTKSYTFGVRVSF